jgi:hypothetical protein
MPRLSDDKIISLQEIQARNLQERQELPGFGAGRANFQQPDAAMKTHFGVPRRSLNTQADEPINWRRGLYRVWILLSTAWLMGWTIYLLMYGLRGGFKTTGDWVVIPVLLFGPPVALLLFGLAARWAFRGFKIDTPTIK